MNKLDTGVPIRGGRMRIPRSRGATSGFLLILLGIWGALIPFVGPYFDFAYTPDTAWTWTDARGWLEVLPGAATVLAGLLLLGSRNRATAMLGAWLAVIAGAWFVVGSLFASLLNIGDPGAPVAATEFKSAMLQITYFYGLGALIAVLGGMAAGRLSVRSVRDISYAHRPVTAQPEPAAELEPEPVEAAADSHEPTTVQPAAQAGPAHQRERRSGRDMFSRRKPATTAHR